MAVPRSFNVRRRAPLLAALTLALVGAGAVSSVAGEPTTLVQQGAQLTGGEESGAGRFGRAVALSADGNTALIGGPHDDGEAGAAWVFTRSGSTWAQQGPKLTGAGEVGNGGFGHSVALSADGDTALVGAPTDSSGHGAVWVFVRSGSTWTQQTELAGEGEGGKAWFGHSVALSADGDTAIVGGSLDRSDIGAAWVFTRSGATWTEQGPKLTGGEEENGAAEFGWSVALSGDGDAALIGAPHDGERVGAAWVFARSGDTWSQQGPKLTGGEESGPGELGSAVALSGDGDTALIGGMHDGERVGAAWVFARSGDTWLQQGPKLTGGGEEGAAYFGDAVALSEDGGIGLIGALHDSQNRGAAWVFARSGDTWSQQGSKLTGGEAERGRGQFGWGVALSADGASALVGGIAEETQSGAAWGFGTEAPPPSPPDDQSGGQTPGAQPQGVGGITTVTGPSPGQGVAAFKASGGAIVLLHRRLTVHNGRARVRLRCTAPTACRGRLTLVLRVRAHAAHRTRLAVIAKTGFSIPHGRAATVTLRLPPAVRRRLHPGHRLASSLTVRQLAPHPRGARVYAVKVVLPRRRG